MISQLVSLALLNKCTGSDGLVPIVIKVQMLQARMRKAPSTYESAWNWVDAEMKEEYGDASPAYRFLRQTMMARRALLLIDGLDEGGTSREKIQRHMTEVLAPQGHVMLCTSRPTGLQNAADQQQFTDFKKMKLAPLTDAQQKTALVERLGFERATELL
eukprot:6250729-Prymnesium_polylepis.1